jgi:hypothetical protein
MYEKDLVDIKELDVIPPNEMNTSYRCEYSKLKPPVGSNLLMHYFRCPQDATILTPCLRKIPKKNKPRIESMSGEGRFSGMGPASCRRMELEEDPNWIMHRVYFDKYGGRNFVLEVRAYYSRCFCYSEFYTSVLCR